MSNNPVIYWELASHDAPKTVEFLKKVFDWDFAYDHPRTARRTDAGAGRWRLHVAERQAAVPDDLHQSR
jgi:predicted enzyme related to lactoylglutathione lyase